MPTVLAVRPYETAVAVEAVADRRTDYIGDKGRFHIAKVRVTAAATATRTRTKGAIALPRVSGLA